MATRADGYETVQVESRAAWRSWLTEHHATSPGIWLVTFKKAAGERYLPWEAIVEEALCFGWIDSKGGKVDAERTKLVVTPRKARSPWSAINKRLVVRLIEEGLMTPAGMARIEAAKANGDWSISDASESLTIPDDLAAAFGAVPAAEAAFEALTESRRKQLLAWVGAAKRPETRGRRIARLAAEVAEGRDPLDRPAQGAAETG